MSILGALKVQKANQQSIADLAALPQNQIIRLAQMGQIPSDVVPVVISEKARMAKEAANMRAAQQTGGGEMPTVIEQAMQANAQQEMPRAAESGVAGIPLGQMFQEKNFKSGGIVAFQSGGDVDPESEVSVMQRPFTPEIGKFLPRRRADFPVTPINRPISDEENARAEAMHQFEQRIQEEDYLRKKAASDRFMAAERAMSPGQKAVEQDARFLARAEQDEINRAKFVEGIRQQYGDEAANEAAATGAYFPPMQASLPVRAVDSPSENIPAGIMEASPRAAAQPAAPAAAAQSAGIMTAPPVAPAVQVGAQPPAGLAAAMTGRTSTAEGDAGVAQAQAAEAARRVDGEAPTAAAAPKGFEEVLANIRRAYGGPETANITPERKTYLDMLKTGSMSPRDIERQQGMRFLQAGLGILGGKSRYALQNIGEGSKEALQGYAEDLKAQRAQKMAEAKSSAEIADLRRAEQRQEVNTALDVYGKQLDRDQRARLAAERTSVADRFARNYAAKMQKAGDKRVIEDLLDEGYVRYLEEAGQAQERITQSARTAAAGQGVQLAGQQVTSQGQAQDARATALNAFLRLPRDNPMAKEYRRLARIDKDNAEKGNPTSLAEAFKNRKINEMAQGIVDGQAAAPTQPGPAAGAAGPAPLGTASNPIRIQ